ncbi:hypothetical protein [Paraburkholderia unamae]|uniref:Uncharacterized protein n=1 Tax=Paraburkholderia unamae TaxID=219649 RepID=A0ACC6RTZ8_9BURK
MKLLSFLSDFWYELSFKAKFTLCTMVLCAAVGLPRTEGALMWQQIRIAMGLQNCIDDFSNPLMAALAGGDESSVERALGPDKPQQLRSCGSQAIQHPKGTVPFVLDEYQRGFFSSARK